MNSAQTLTELASRLHRDSASTEDKAEFIRLVAQLQDIDSLKSLLSVNYDYAGIVLERITELLPGDAKACLALALWKYNKGLDEAAFDLFERARELISQDRDILRADVWFSFSRDAKTILDKCRILLDAFPDDHWARKVYQQIKTHGQLTELESPDWDNPWLDLMNRTWRPQ